MTRRRRLRRRLLWAGVLLGLVLLLAAVSLLRAGAWVRRHVSTLTRPSALGTYARTPAAAQRAVWLDAPMLRSDALDRRHSLGAYAPGS